MEAFLLSNDLYICWKLIGLYQKRESFKVKKGFETQKKDVMDLIHKKFDKNFREKIASRASEYS